MTSIQQKLATGRGKFTPEYPDLGTGPVNYEDSISEEFFGAERKAVFERSWLCVGRMERLPRKGSYFTRELPGQLASIVITRDLDDNVYAFHNVCAHRGNKVVWQEHPMRSPRVAVGQFACKYHGWRYGLDGVVNHITNEEEFFDLDKSKLRMPPVHCEVWAGFIFINLAEDPVPLRTFLGEGLLGIEAYPFHLMTQHYGFSTQIKGNWKLAVDSVASGTTRRTSTAVSSTPTCPWRRLARHLAERQLQTLHAAIDRVLSRGALGDDAPVVGAGVGRFLVRPLAERLRRPYVDFASLVEGEPATREWAARCAPAAAVAILAAEGW